MLTKINLGTRQNPIEREFLQLLFVEMACPYKYCVIGRQGFIASSTDGTKWRQATSGTVEDLKEISYRDGFWRVKGDKLSMVSRDTITWSFKEALGDEFPIF